MSIRYVAVRVNNNSNNPLQKEFYFSVQGALRGIVVVADPNGDWWRVVEIPSGEPLDYDGTVVADLRTGRLW